MEDDSISILQLPLFAYGETVTNVVEIFPAVWKATEALTSPDAPTRLNGIDALAEVGAQRVSPLVAYMLATCLFDEEINIRKKVLQLIADLVVKDASGHQTPGEVMRVVTHYLHNMHDEMIYALLEISVSDTSADPYIYHLLNACPYGGKFLGDILIQWKNPLPIRHRIESAKKQKLLMLPRVNRRLL